MILTIFQGLDPTYTTHPSKTLTPRPRPNQRLSLRINLLNPTSCIFKTHFQTRPTARPIRPHHFLALTCPSTPAPTVRSTFRPTPISKLRGAANVRLSPRPPARIAPRNPSSANQHQQPTFNQFLGLIPLPPISRLANLQLQLPAPAPLQRMIPNLAQHLPPASELNPGLWVSHALGVPPDKNQADRTELQRRGPIQKGNHSPTYLPKCANRQTPFAPEVSRIKLLDLPMRNVNDPPRLT